MALFSSLDIAGSALTAERFRTDIVLQNIANADTTKTESGEPYRRQQVVMQDIPMTFEEELKKASGKNAAQTASAAATSPTVATGGVKVTKVVHSDRDFTLRYEPDNPDADANGYVKYPNVDKTEEMVDLMAASNAYEANVTALNVVKAMINKTLDMGNK